MHGARTAMSDDLNTEIRITASADGVEAGVRNAKQSIAGLSQAAEKAGEQGGKGLGKIGAGGEGAARKVEAATKNMAASLERMIAKVEAGGTATRQYQESIARMRGADMGALKPYLDQLDAAKVKAESAARAQGGLEMRLGTLGGVADVVRGQLIALAGSVTLGAMFAFVKNVNDGVDALNDIKDATGATIENISALEDVALRTGGSLDLVGSVLIKFNDVLSKATPKSDMALALESIGLKAEELRKLDPAEALRQTAVALSGYADDANKARLVQELFGKSVKDAAPFLADLAEKGALLAKVTTAQTAEAEKFNKQLFDLKTTAGEAGRALVSDMLPGLNQITTAMAKGAKEGGLLLGVYRGIAEFGSIALGTDELGSAMRDANAAQAEMVRLQSVMLGVQNTLERDPGNAAAQRRLDGLRAQLEGVQKQALSATSALKGLLGSPAVGDVPPVETTKPSVTPPKSAAEIGAAASAAKKGAEDLRRELAEQAKLVAELHGLSGSFAEDWARLSKVYTDKSGVVNMEALAAAQAKLLEKQPAIKAAADAEKKMLEELAKASQLVADARNKEADGITAWFQQQQAAAEQSLRSVTDRVAALQTEEAAVTLATSLNISLAEAIERVAIERMREKQAGFIEGSEGWQAIEREIAARKELLGLVSSKAQREDEARGWADMWQSVDRTAHDVFVNVLEGGQDAFKRLGNTLKASVLDVLYQMTVRKWIINIGTSVFGAGFGAAANAATGGGAGGALSTAGGIGNIASLASGIGSFTTAGMLPTGIATALTGSTSSLAMGLSGAWGAGGGMLSTLNAGASMLGSGSIMSGLGTLAGALGPIALGIAALAAIFGKKATPHAGAASTYSEAGGLVSGADIYRASGLADTRTYNAGVEQVTGNVAKAIGDTLNATARTFGKEAGYEISTAFADDTSKDGAWGSLMIRRGGESVIDWRDTQTSKWAPREFADGEAGSKEYLAAVAKSARDALVGAIGDVDWATDMLTALGESPTLEGLAGTVQQINAAQAAFESLGKNIVGFGALTDGAISALVKAAGSIDGLVSAASAYYDNFYSESEKAANVTRDVTAALADVGLEMPKTRDEFRALVESQMALGEAGAPAVAALLGVSGAFAALTPALDAMVASVGINAEQISTTLRDGLLGRISGEEMGASIGTMITNGIQNAIAGSFADQITQIFMQGIVNPVIQAAMTGSSISAAVSQASIDAMVKQAQGAAAAIGAILNDPGFQSAMAQIQAAIGSFTGASSVGYRAPVVSGGGGGYDSGGFSDSVEAVDTAWKDLLKSIVESTLAAQTELSRLGMTSYERALAEIDDKANDLLKQIAEDRGFADMRTQLAGAEQRQSSFSALAESIRASVAQDGDRLVNGGTAWLSDVGAQYQREADAAAEAIARLRAELTDMPEEVRKLIEAERALLEARNALRAMEITGDLRTDIERLGMSDMERTLAGIGDRAKDYIKSLEDIGQATEDNIGIVGEWEKAMRLDAIKKAWEGVSNSMLDEIDRIRGSLAGDGGLAALQAEFAINTAAARAGDKDAAGSLAGLSRDILRLSEGSAGSAFEWARLQAQMLASLEESARIAALMGQGGGSPIVDGRIISEAHTQQPGQTIVGHHGMGGEIAYPIVTPYIPPAPQSSNAELIAEIRLLNRRLETLEANTQATALHTQKTSKALERAMPGGDAIATREVAA